MVKITNKRATFDYEILKKFQTGIKLTGNEVKSVRNGNVALEGSHCVVRGGELFLVGTHIAPYQNHIADIEKDRTRKLLAKKKEIDEIRVEEKQKGITIVPLSLYSKNGILKLDIAICKGRKKFDKKVAKKEKALDREAKRVEKNSFKFFN